MVQSFLQLSMILQVRKSRATEAHSLNHITVPVRGDRLYSLPLPPCHSHEPFPSPPFTIYPAACSLSMPMASSLSLRPCVTSFAFHPTFWVTALRGRLSVFVKMVLSISLPVPDSFVVWFCSSFPQKMTPVSPSLESCYLFWLL